MKSAIVTGASGFVGRHLGAYLQKYNVVVTPYDNRTTSSNKLPKADVFYHLAWEGASGELRPDPFVQTKNVNMTLEALKTAHELGCNKFVALGTVYEKLAPQIRASDRFRSADFYILAKEYAHTVTSKLANKLDIEFSWCTVCHPIGKGIKPEQMMAYTVSSLKSGVSPDFGPADSYFDIIAVEDLVSGLYLVGEKGRRSEYFIGSGEAKFLKEYLLQVPKILGVDATIKIGAREDDGLRFEKDWFDISPLIMDTGYFPKIGFDEAVKLCESQFS